MDPAERTSTWPPLRWFRKPAAIWERPALWTHTNRALGRAVVSVTVTPQAGGVVVEVARRLRAGTQRLAQRLQRGGDGGVPDVGAALLAGHQAGLAQNPQVVADRRLALADRLHQVAGADGAALGGGE